MALGPSLLAQLSYIRGVELIGPNRAGLFVNLVPVFGAGLAVMLAGEPFDAFDGVALALVLGGILIAETAGRRASVREGKPKVVVMRPQVRRIHRL